MWLSYEQICKLPVSDFPHMLRWWKAVQDQPGGAELATSRP